MKLCIIQFKMKQSARLEDFIHTVSQYIQPQCGLIYKCFKRTQKGDSVDPGCFSNFYSNLNRA